MKPKLKIPARLVVIALGAALSGCPGSGQVHGNNDNLCPADYFCTSDAARAFNCTDAATDPFQTDLGSCFPPV